SREVTESQKEIKSQAVVCFQNVTFQYLQNAAPVLRQLSFSVKAGETVAIIGGTGAGKTTLLRMALAEYKANQGNILVNGKDVQSYDPKELSKKISYVPQNSGLFKGSIAENLRFRKADASEEELWEALADAQAEDFIRQMEKGLEAEAAQGAKNLSGGQRQRLAVARALVGDAQIYLIDDCFSALDHETASRLHRSLAKKIKGAAVLMATSQISMIDDVDKIIVLDQGQIVGMGSHGALMQDCAFYRQLAHSQGIGEVTADAR
ncbi:MAG: ABC transporter ATP-binding protein, partial [Eubacteriales bacterium]|nr:ABC transporter ATP-binding protein [Eubacteriales bacterium]